MCSRIKLHAISVCSSSTQTLSVQGTINNNQPSHIISPIPLPASLPEKESPENFIPSLSVQINVFYVTLYIPRLTRNIEEYTCYPIHDWDIHFADIRGDYER